MTYGVDPSSGIDLSKQQPQPGTQAYGAPGPQAYGQQPPPPPGPTNLAGDVEVRPSKDQYRSFLAKTPIAFIVVIVIVYLREGLVGMLIGLVVGVLALGGVLLYIARARVRMDALSVTRRGFVGTTSFARADLGQVILAPYQASTADSRVSLTLIALDRQGKRVLRLGSAIWRPVDLERLAHTMGPAPVVYSDVLNPKALTERHPGSVSWAERHPWIVGIVATVVIIVVIVVVIVAMES
ncbi:hypothetical protein [Sanguibacter sp. 25GB23B1]|uniref:hypothetical protein n=1 Tax=unclassified Sanguibacter TaxID=2645534 RepID=UPI0032AF290C